MTMDHARLINSLIEVRSIAPDRVAAGLRVIGTLRRDRVWIVRMADGPAYVVKQASDDAGMRRLAREAAVYDHLRGIERCHGPFLPELVRYDEQRGLLILDCVEGTSLSEIVAERGHNRTAPASVLGSTLAHLHQTGIDFLDPGLALDKPPWVLSIHRPNLDWYTRSREANLQMYALIQQHPELTNALDVLRGEWTAGSLIHSDMKLEHVIASRRRRVCIIDWEAAQLGDPAWDIGAIFAGYLLRWLRSIPLISDRMPGEFSSLATVPIQQIQASVNAFWQAYAQTASFDGITHQRLLLRSTRSAAAILIQREDEYLQSADATDGRTSLILQVSNNMLVQPEVGSAVLLGLDAGTGGLS